MNANLARFAQMAAQQPPQMQPGRPPMMPQQMPPQMQQLAAQGRMGDAVMAHLTPGEITVPPEIQSPKVLATLRSAFQKEGVNPAQFTAGSPQSSINPQTGAPEYSYWSAILPVAGAIAGAYLTGGSPWGAAAGGAAGGAIAGGAVEGGGINGALLGGALGGAGGYFGGSALSSAFPETFGAGAAEAAGAAGAGAAATGGAAAMGGMEAMAGPTAAGAAGSAAGTGAATGASGSAASTGVLGFLRANPSLTLLGAGGLTALLASRNNQGTGTIPTSNGMMDQHATPLDQLPRRNMAVTPANFNPLTAGYNPVANYYPQGSGLPGLGNAGFPSG